MKRMVPSTGDDVGAHQRRDAESRLVRQIGRRAPGIYHPAPPPVPVNAGPRPVSVIERGSAGRPESRNPSACLRE
jgi:hypothetical protein